jgi:hypothetical protein
MSSKMLKGICLVFDRAQNACAPIVPRFSRNDWEAINSINDSDLYHPSSLIAAYGSPRARKGRRASDTG